MSCDNISPKITLFLISPLTKHDIPGVRTSTKARYLEVIPYLVGRFVFRLELGLDVGGRLVVVLSS